MKHRLPVAARSMGKKDDDKPEETKAWDYVVVCFIGLGSLFYIAGIAVLLKYRKYKPIEVRGVWLTLASSVGGLTWMLATIVILGHFPRPKGNFIAICSLWTFWLWACFGFALWLNCLTVRMRQLHAVFKQGMHMSEPDHMRWTVIPLFILLLPAIILSTSASAKHAVKYEENLHNCKITNLSFAIATICLVPIYFIIFLSYAFRLRTIMSHWNEFRQIRIGGIMSFFLYLLSVVTILSKVYYRVPGRSFLSLAVAGAVFYYFWARNWELIYNVLFHKQAYCDRFFAELSRLNERSSSSQFEPNPMERLVMKTKEDARRYQQRLHQLEIEVTNLAQEHSLLQNEIAGVASAGN